MSDELLAEFNRKYPLKHIQIDKTQWEYLSQGNGSTTLLILPGGGQYAQSQYQMVDQFSNKYKVIIPSIYGVYSIDDCCQGINEILRTEGAKTLIVYGLSIGALIAQSYTKRNLGRVKALIISHGCAPNSPNYEKKIIRPLRALSILLPVIPPFLITFIAKKWAGKIQGVSKKVTKNFNFGNNQSDSENKIRKLLAKRFYEQYLTKTLLYTWIKLHFDFYKNEKFSKNDFEGWDGKVLILRTENDPLMQDGGKFKDIYPGATVKTFRDTGHLTVIYQFDEIINSINKFLLGL